MIRVPTPPWACPRADCPHPIPISYVHMGLKAASMAGEVSEGEVRGGPGAEPQPPLRGKKKGNIKLHPLTTRS